MGLSLALGVYLGAANGGQAAALAPSAFSPDSIFRAARPDSPTLAANSSAYVTKVNGWGGPDALAAGVAGTTSDFDLPVYFAKATDPLFTINASANDARSFDIQGTSIRIPDAALPAGGADSHMLVVDPDLGWVTGFFDVNSKPAGGGTIACTGVGRYRYFGDGFDNANEVAAKVAGLGGLILAEEFAAQRIPHALQMVVKSTDGTNTWPASGNAGSTDPTNSPPDGAWFFYDDTAANIEAEGVANGWPRDTITIVKALAEFGAYVVDTGGQSFYFRMKSDASTKSLGLGEPIKAHADREGDAGGWYLDGGTGFRYLDLKATVDWAGKLKVIDPTYAKGLYDARLAHKKLDPSATLLDGATAGPNAPPAGWTKTGATTIHACLTEATYAPFSAGASPRIGSNQDAMVGEWRHASYTPAVGRKARAIIFAVFDSTPALVSWDLELKSGNTVLGTKTVPASSSLGWRFISYQGDMSAVDFSDLRGKATQHGTAFSNGYAGHIIIEEVAS